MFEILFSILMWMFVVGAVGCLVLVIPITAYRLFSVMFQKDNHEEQYP
jgi:hypothetical protein